MEDRAPWTKLVTLEGPAGVGKTSVAEALQRVSADAGRSVVLVPEFSATRLGRFLEAESSFEAPRFGWRASGAATLVYLSDKIASLEAPLVRQAEVVIVDRWLTSQLVLGLDGVWAEDERGWLSSVIQATVERVTNGLAMERVGLYLHAPVGILRSRLEARMGRALTADEERRVDSQAKAYERVCRLDDRAVLVDASGPLPQVVMRCAAYLGSSDGDPR